LCPRPHFDLLCLCVSDSDKRWRRSGGGKKGEPVKKHHMHVITCVVMSVCVWGGVINKMKGGKELLLNFNACFLNIARILIKAVR